MSGIIRALSAISSIPALLGGAPPVVLGPVQFSGIEVPARIPFGGQQRLAVHKLPGGARVIDAMGRDDADLAWSGYLEGPFAADRAIEIDQLRVAGQPITLSWDALSFTVVVMEFTPDYQRVNWIPYSIRCVVVTDNAAQSTQSPVPLANLLGSSVAGAIQSITNGIQTVSNTIQQVAGIGEEVLQRVSAFSPILSLVGVNISGPLAQASSLLGDAYEASGVLTDVANIPTGVSNFISSIQTAGSQVMSAFSAGETAVSQVASAASAVGHGGIVSSVSDYFSALLGASTIANTTQAAASLNVAGKAAVLSSGTGLGAAGVLNSIQESGGTVPTGQFSAGGYTFGPEFVVPISQGP